MLINQAEVKKLALACGARRYHKLTRVSKKFLERMDVNMRLMIEAAVDGMPSVGKTIMALAIFLMAGGVAFAISDADIAISVLGEARGESLSGKIALAEAMRNRGRLKGIYGYEAEIKAMKQTLQAVEASKSSSLVKGADVWGTDSDVRKFKKTTWFKKYKFVCKIGKHSFYRRIP